MADPLERLRRERRKAFLYFAIFFAVAAVVQLLRATVIDTARPVDVRPAASVTEPER